MELGKLRLSPEWRRPLVERTESDPLPPGVLFSSSNLQFFLCRETGRAGEWAAGRTGDPPGWAEEAELPASLKPEVGPA